MIVDVTLHQAGHSSFAPIQNCVYQPIAFWTREANPSLGRFPTFPALTVGICLLAKVDASVLPIGLFVVQHFSYWVVGPDQISQIHGGIGGAGGWQIDHGRLIPLFLQVRQAVATVQLTSLASCGEYGANGRMVQQAGDVGRHDIGD